MYIWCSSHAKIKENMTYFVPNDTFWIHLTKKCRKYEIRPKIQSKFDILLKKPRKIVFFRTFCDIYLYEFIAEGKHWTESTIPIFCYWKWLLRCPHESQNWAQIQKNAKNAFICQKTYFQPIFFLSELTKAPTGHQVFQIWVYSVYLMQFNIVIW